MTVFKGLKLFERKKTKFFLDWEFSVPIREFHQVKQRFFVSLQLLLNSISLNWLTIPELTKRFSKQITIFLLGANLSF